MATINEQIRTQVYVVNSSITSDSSIPSQSKDRIAYSTIDKKLYRFDGSAWAELLEASSSIKLVDNFSALPTEAKAGDCAITKDTNKQYYYDGSAWVLIDTAEKTTFTPSITLGGITAGDKIEDMTAEEILKQLLVKELFPSSATAPSASITVKVGTSNLATSYEYGKKLENITITGSAKLGSVSGYDTTGTKVYINEGTEDNKVIVEKSASEVSWAGPVASTNGYKFTGTEITANGVTQNGNSYSIASYDVSATSADPKWTVAITLTAGPDFVGTNGGHAASNGTYTGDITSNKVVSASKSFNVMMPWFATTSSCNVLNKQSNFDAAYTTLPSNSTTASISNGKTLCAESSTTAYRQAFLVPAAWNDDATIEIKQWNDVANAFNIDATSEFVAYKATVSFDETTGEGTITVGDLLSATGNGSSSYSSLEIKTTGGVPELAKSSSTSVNKNWVYIVHEGDAGGSRTVYFKK